VQSALGVIRRPSEKHPMIGPRLAALLLAASLPAQIVHFANLGPVAFEGWKRCTIDVMPPHSVGVVSTPGGGTYLYQVGRHTGLDTHALDVRLHLEPGQRLTLDLSTGTPCAAPILEAPPVAWFGGLAEVTTGCWGSSRSSATAPVSSRTCAAARGGRGAWTCGCIGTRTSRGRAAK
jgi:hypothetical protein